MSNGMTNAVDRAVLLQQKTEAVQEYVMHHLRDSPILSILGLKIPLPPFLSSHGVMAVLAAIILAMLFLLLYDKKSPVPRGWTNVLEMFVLLIRDHIAIPFLGKEDGRRMTPLFCTLFFYILTMNLLGLIPCFQAATGDVSVTAALALVVFGVMVLGAGIRHGPVGFFKGFIPHGVPWPVLLLLVPIEIVGLGIKAFALSIRLFANMFAGHVVIFFLLGLVVIFGAGGLPFVVLGLFVYIMEIGVAFLQAYIFTLLSAIFIGQRYHPDH